MDKWQKALTTKRGNVFWKWSWWEQGDPVTTLLISAQVGQDRKRLKAKGKMTMAVPCTHINACPTVLGLARSQPLINVSCLSELMNA